MFNFKTNLESGQHAAEQVRNSRKEIREILNQLISDITDFLKCDVELLISDEYELKFEDELTKSEKISRPFGLGGVTIGGTSKLPTRIQTGYKTISIKSEFAAMSIFHFKEGNAVYPLNVKGTTSKHKFIVENKDEFIHAIGAILEDPKTHEKFSVFLNTEKGEF